MPKRAAAAASKRATAANEQASEGPTTPTKIMKRKKQQALNAVQQAERLHKTAKSSRKSGLDADGVDARPSVDFLADLAQRSKHIARAIARPKRRPGSNAQPLPKPSSIVSSPRKVTKHHPGRRPAAVAIAVQPRYARAAGYRAICHAHMALRHMQLNRRSSLTRRVRPRVTAASRQRARPCRSRLPTSRSRPPLRGEPCKQ